MSARLMARVDRNGRRPQKNGVMNTTRWALKDGLEA